MAQVCHLDIRRAKRQQKKLSEDTMHKGRTIQRQYVAIQLRRISVITLEEEIQWGRGVIVAKMFH